MNAQPIKEKHSYEEDEEEESPNTQVADERFASPHTFLGSDDGQSIYRKSIDRVATGN